MEAQTKLKRKTAEGNDGGGEGFLNSRETR
jgi:hypothetical protein